MIGAWFLVFSAIVFIYYGISELVEKYIYNGLLGLAIGFMYLICGLVIFIGA